MVGQKIKRVVVVTAESGDEAIYVDGVLVDHYCTIYACDIASAAGDGPIRFSHMLARPPGTEFPERLDDLKQFVVK